MSNLRAPDPIMARAALSAVLTREQLLENMLEVFIRAGEGSIHARHLAEPCVQRVQITDDILSGAIVAARILLAERG